MKYLLRVYFLINVINIFIKFSVLARNRAPGKLMVYRVIVGRLNGEWYVAQCFNDGIKMTHLLSQRHSLSVNATFVFLRVGLGVMGEGQTENILFNILNLRLLQNIAKIDK